MATVTPTWVDRTVLEAPPFSAILPYLQTVHVKPASYQDAAALVFVLLVGAVFASRRRLWDKPDPYGHLYYERPQVQDASSGDNHKAERNIATAMDTLDKRVVVFWGSQSGTAEGLAIRLSSEISARFGVGSLAADLSDYDCASIAMIPASKMAIFVMSTFGEGNPSDNALEFCEYASGKEQNLDQLRYAAFGLGNSNYKYYNKVIDDVAAWLDARKATPLMPVGRANDAEGTTVEDFISWKTSLFRTLSAHWGIEEKPLQFQTALSVLEDTSLDIIDLHDGTPVHSMNPQPLPVILSKELFQSSERNCLHLELDIKQSPQIRYKTGDHLAVFPVNPADEVDRLLFALGMTDRPDTPIIIRSNDPAVKVKVPNPTSVLTLLRHHLEICAQPSRDAVQMLMQFCPDENAKQFLANASRSRETYAEIISKHHLTLGRLLQLSSGNQPWPKLPLSYIVTVLAPIQPRYYSISSSSVIDPRKPSITALVTRTPLPHAPESFINGVTTTYMKALTSGSQPAVSAPAPPTLFAQVRKSKFKLPLSTETPLLMVAAGTGLAPFRAFVAERQKMHAMGRPVAPMLLFFGCRSPDDDYIYRRELEQARDALPEGCLRVVECFSRCGGGRRMYVQDGVRAEAEDVCRMLSRDGANLYICGRASMAREVGKAVVAALVGHAGLSEGDADQFVHGLKGRHKWQEDVWG